MLQAIAKNEGMGECYQVSGLGMQFRSYNLRERGGAVMRFAKPVGLLLAFAVFAATAMAADNANSVPAHEQLRIPILETGSGASSLAASHGDADALMILRLGSRGQGIDLSPFADVCFTMRTYKVKPTERLQDGEGGSRGYSICQMGSGYKVRTAGDPPVKLK
jgi:hypothetical protein